MMTHKQKGHYAKKHPSDRKLKPEVAEAVKAGASKGEIPCVAAFEIASKLRVPPAEIGFALDVMEIRISKCQLGLYGYKPEKRIVKPAETVPQVLEQSIREALVNEKLPCAAAWEIAEKLDMAKMEITSACEAMSIKISACQLGAF
jgi:hypothetical protein